MRVLISRFARARDEEGATLVIVVLCIIALFGMIVLVVDVGGLLLRRRSMVNGSDAAALAAAKSCVLPTALDPRTPEQASDEWATLNVDGVVVGGSQILQIANCDGGSAAPSGYVSVRYQSPQGLFFAPVLGYPDTGTVTADATAIWGPPGRANPMPIVVYANNFNDCRLDTDPTPGAQCYIWEDNNNTQGSQSGFGFLDLRTDPQHNYGWDASNLGGTCTGQNADQWLEDYPDPDVGELPINFPAPTYVCRLSGNQSNAWAELANLIDDDDTVDNDDEEDVLFFPINRCYDTPTGTETDGQIFQGPGNSIVRQPCGETPTKYDIIGFVGFKLKNIYTPNQVQPTTQSCLPGGPFQRSFPTASPLNLDSAGIFEGCFASAPATIDANSVQVTRIGGGSQSSNPSPAKAPVGSTCTGIAPAYDYCFDSASRNIVWNTNGPISTAFAAPRNYNLRFNWSTGGPCGIPPAGNNSGHCLVVEYVEIAIGGGGPGSGNPDSNIRAYKLCEPTVASTCAPINVPVP